MTNITYTMRIFLRRFDDNGSIAMFVHDTGPMVKITLMFIFANAMSKGSVCFHVLRCTNPEAQMPLSAGKARGKGRA
jgi:hypothetical protein